MAKVQLSSKRKNKRMSILVSSIKERKKAKVYRNTKVMFIRVTLEMIRKMVKAY